jgi:carbohydrate kinase (thermoresistant glucokinase family)
MARVVVMGVSGCGKSTLAQALAQALNWRYIEGDQHHSAANIEKMSAGTPLNDDDRADWLHTLSGLIGQATQAQEGLVLTCSALKRKYRDVLRQGDAGLLFLHLQGSKAVIAPRMNVRTGHYMPPSLLDSQLRDLEMPQADERILALDVAQAPEQLLQHALHHLNLLSEPASSP